MIPGVRVYCWSTDSVRYHAIWDDGRIRCSLLPEEFAAAHGSHRRDDHDNGDEDRRE